MWIVVLAWFELPCSTKFAFVRGGEDQTCCLADEGNDGEGSDLEERGLIGRLSLVLGAVSPAHYKLKVA